MIRLVKGQLKVNRLVVKRNVGVFGPRQIDDRYFTHPEVGIDFITSKRSLHFVQKRIFQRPQLKIGHICLKSQLGLSFGDGLGRNIAGTETCNVEFKL